MTKNWIFLMLLFLSCKASSNQSFTASTPAGREVRKFLGIQEKDSVDFIRWNLDLKDEQFSLRCQYGIGKNNTNGFIDDGFNVAFSGSVTRTNGKLRLVYEDRLLLLFTVNDQLLHIMDSNNKLMVGNGAWSYGLNLISNQSPHPPVAGLQKLSIIDSAIFEGRTPCGIPELISPGESCYKLKWRINLYDTTGKGESGNYAIYGTVWRNPGPKRGRWSLDVNSQKLTLFNEKDKPFIYLVPMDNKVLYFTNEKFLAMAGNQDFSYILNRR